MTAEELTHTYTGAPICGCAASSKTGLHSVIVDVTSTENDDWIVLSEFEAIKFVMAVAISSDVHTPEVVTIDGTTTNKIVLQAGSTDVLRILVIGTKAN